MKHTPGPWSVVEGRTMYTIKGPGFTGPAERHTGYAIPKEEREANARLIAAAPELLEACEILHDASQDVFNLLAGSRPLITVPQALDAIVEAMSKARAAINKARGEK